MAKMWTIYGVDQQGGAPCVYGTSVCQLCRYGRRKQNWLLGVLKHPYTKYEFK